MIKRIKQVLNNNKGLTLFEMLLAMIVFAVITLAAVSVFAPAINTYVRANNLAEVNTLLDNVAGLIMEDVASMTDEITGGPQLPFTIFTTRDVVYNVNTDGMITRNGVALFDEGFLRRMSMSAELAEVHDFAEGEVHDFLDGMDDDELSAFDGVFALRLTLNADDGWTTTRYYMARPVAMQ